MKLAIEGFVTSFFLIMLLYLSLGMINAQITASNARSYYTEVCKEIEESNYDKAFVESAIKQAEADGYKLWVDCISTDVAHCEECNYTQRKHEVLSMNSPLTFSLEHPCADCGVLDITFEVERANTNGTKKRELSCAECGKVYTFEYNVKLYSGSDGLDGTLEQYSYTLKDPAGAVIVSSSTGNGQWDSYLTKYYRTDVIDDRCDVCNGKVISRNTDAHGVITLVYPTKVPILGVSKHGVFEQAF